MKGATKMMLMKTLSRPVIGFLAMFLACAVVEAGEVRFTREPAIGRVGDRTIVEFAVDRETDVAIQIESADGKVVRHLAAGMLGGQAPAPLKAGLTQSLEWDGLDDYGEKAVGGPFSARVSAGLKPEFDGFMFYDPDATGRIDALAVGPEGRVYVFHKDDTLVHWWGHKIKILTREGKHFRAIWPYPADLDPKKIKALGPFQTTDGDLVPRIYQALQLSFYPQPAILNCDRYAGTSEPAVDGAGRVYWLAPGPALVCLDADGGVPYDTFVGPTLLGEVKNLTARDRWKMLETRPCLAVSGDGKHIYFAGLNTFEGATRAWLPCVYRVDLETRGKAEVFVGKSGSPGKEGAQLVAPRGLAVAKGLLYVADPDADRVVVFQEEDRSYAGEIKVQRPHSIGVDPATGAVYVCSYTGSLTGNATADLIKFDSYKSGKALYKLALPQAGLRPNGGVHRIAVDASAKPIRIWMPSTGNWGKYAPTCIEDTGQAFVDKGYPLAKTAPVARARGACDLSFDRRRGELYVRHDGDCNWYRINEKTGEIKNLGLNTGGIGAQLVAAPDGSLVTLSEHSGGLIRHDRDGKRLNWPGQNTPTIPHPGIMNFTQRTLAVKSLDELYAILPSDYRAKPGGPYCSVDVLGADGRTKRTAIWQCSHGAILRLDHKGNIYVADMVRPPDRSYPEFFTGKVGPDDFWMNYLYASIVKFPPSGGAIWYDRKAVSSSAEGKPPQELLAKPTIKVRARRNGGEPMMAAELQGAEWYRHGFSPFASSSGSFTCMCEGAGFDVDLFGRVFYPNVGQFRVEVVDAANNMIGTFGKYGNQDSAGKGAKDSLVKKPDIPLAWPLTVAVSDTRAYVADTINRRLVRVRLGYEAEATCALR